MKMFFAQLSVFAMMSWCHLFAFTYSGAGEKRHPDTIKHPVGYVGKGGLLKITVGLHPDFGYLQKDVEFSASQAVAIWNNLVVTTGNLTPSAEIPRKGGTDVMGVLIHELGHALGLAHPNSKHSPKKCAKSTLGENHKLDYDPGRDGIIGSCDDLRGDDVSLNYFNVASNNPFSLPGSGIIDVTTYSRDLGRLPENHSYAAIANRKVAEKCYNLENTVAIMKGGGSLIPGLVRRSLCADDVAGIRYAMSGLDGKQGTGDDYKIRLIYVGVDAHANVVIKFDGSGAPAGCGHQIKKIKVDGRKVEGRLVIQPGVVIRYNPSLPWHFPVLNKESVQTIIKQEDTTPFVINTTPGRRYALAVAKNSQLAPQLLSQISASIKGKEIPMTGAEYLFFIADADKTQVDITCPKGLKGNIRYGVYEILGKPLRMKEN